MATQFQNLNCVLTFDDVTFSNLNDVNILVRKKKKLHTNTERIDEKKSTAENEGKKIYTTSKIWRFEEKEKMNKIK